MRHARIPAPAIRDGMRWLAVYTACQDEECTPAADKNLEIFFFAEVYLKRMQKKSTEMLQRGRKKLADIEDPNGKGCPKGIGQPENHLKTWGHEKLAPVGLGCRETGGLESVCDAQTSWGGATDWSGATDGALPPLQDLSDDCQ